MTTTLPLPLVLRLADLFPTLLFRVKFASSDKRKALSVWDRPLLFFIRNLNNTLEEKISEIDSLPYEQVLSLLRILRFSKTWADTYEYRFKQWALTGNEVGIAYARYIALIQDLYYRLENAKALKEPKKPFVRSVMKAPEGFDFNTSFTREELYGNC